MAMEVISIKRSTGEYEGNHYDNFNVFVIDNESHAKSLVAGGEVSTLKIKADNFLTACGRELPKAGLQSSAANLLYCEIEPVYNRYGGVDDFRVVSVPEAT